MQWSRDSMNYDPCLQGIGSNLHACTWVEYR